MNAAFLCCPACGKEWDAHPGTVPMCEENRRLREKNQRLRDIIRRAHARYIAEKTAADAASSMFVILKEAEVEK